jgi:hypothetical protein
LRPSEELPDDYLAQYDKVLDLSANRHRSLSDLMADMDASGTSHAVVHAEYEYGDGADALNEAVAKVVNDNPGRFSGFGTISMGPVKIPRALAQVRRVADLGLTGLSLQPSFFGVPIDDRVLYPVYAKASELGLPVALHTGINYTVSFPIRNDQPIQLDQIACDFPELVLIACHAGWPWVPEMVAVLRKHPNVYAEFGGLAPRYVCEPNTGWEVMYRFMNSLLGQQVLHGTDWPVFPMSRALAEWRAGGLREHVLAALIGGNAQRLLGRVE